MNTRDYIEGYADRLRATEGLRQETAERLGYFCACSGSEQHGDYAENCVTLLLPFDRTRATSFSTTGPIPSKQSPGPIWMASIDRCMVREVSDLWRAGIRTLESCCGHRRSDGYIAVFEEDELAMSELGYPRDPEHPHVFVARTGGEP